jgi:quinol monooxygenase YgiN
MSFVLIVEFELKPGSLGEFMNLIGENARASLRDEKGCIQFDVLRPEGEEDRVVLYERYLDEAAFEAHLRTAHYLAFERRGGPLIKGEQVRRLRQAPSDHGAES